MPPLLPLADDEVHVWCASPELLAGGRPPALVALLSDDERQRMERYVFERDRVLCLATRTLVRHTLSRYLPVEPSEWQFIAESHGRPRIAGDGPPPLRFNLTNTRGLVVCAVTRRLEVGVDAECRERHAALEVADRWFSPTEVAALRALPEEEQPARFFEYWTLKESYIKAHGMGLAMPLHSFAIELSPGVPPRVHIDPLYRDTQGDGSAWQFHQWHPTPEHIAALCVERAEHQVVRVTDHWLSIPAQ